MKSKSAVNTSINCNFCRENSNDQPLSEYVVTFYVFGKADLSCRANWGVKQAILDQ